MSDAWPGGLAVDDDPGNPSCNRNQFPLSVFALFIALIGQGVDVTEVFIVSMAICVGGAEIIRRFPRDEDGRCRPRWA